MVTFVGEKRHCVVFTTFVSLLTLVKHTSSRKLLFKEHHHRQHYFIEEGGYYLFDKSDLVNDFGGAEHDEHAHKGIGTSVGADDIRREDRNMKIELDENSRTKRAASASSSALQNTASFILPDTLPQLLVHWIRNNSSAIVVLTRKLKWNTQDWASTSNLYFSYDYGRTFQKSTLRNTISQYFSSRVDFRRIVFTDVDGQNIITTDDIGRTFSTFSCPFKPSFIAPHPSRDSYMIGYDKYQENHALWLSPDYGRTWRNIEQVVNKAYWGNTEFKNFEHPDALYVEKLLPTGKLNILKSDNFFLDDPGEEYLISNINDFYIRNNSLFAVRHIGYDDKNLFIALNRNSSFLLANFPTDEPKQDFFIVDVADNQIMVLVSFGIGRTHLYISEPNTVNFKLSLENVTYYNPIGVGATTRITKKDPFGDIHKVKGLRSVFIANTGTVERVSNRLTYDMSDMKTVISFDKGATWENIPAPIVDSNGEPFCTDPIMDRPCALQLTLTYHSLHSASYSTPVLSETSSPGYIFAHGVVGNRLLNKGDMFFSANGGNTWKEIRKGEGYYMWADHGGILAYVKKGVKSNIIYYSVDEGHSWKSMVFYPEPIMVYALLTEPGQTSTAFTAFGITRSRHWVLAQIDMKEAFENQICQTHDYISWSPVDDNGAPCLLGSKVSFQRRRGYNSVPCRNGKEFDRQSNVESCPCTKSDFECARGFQLDAKTQSFSCIPSIHGNNDTDTVESICATGTSYSKTRGYQKIHGDKCSGGDAESQYGPVKMACPHAIVKPSEISCDGGRLIPLSSNCDHVEDCDDGTDERNCN